MHLWTKGLMEPSLRENGRWTKAELSEEKASNTRKQGRRMSKNHERKGV